VRSIPAALKRLLPLKRKKEVETERDERNTEGNEAYSDLMEFSAITMRNRGNSDGSALFIPQLNEVMTILRRLGVYEHNDDNEEFIINVIATYERVGRSRIEEVIQAVQQLDEDGEHAETAGMI
jgi:hypothetical protein